MQAAWMAVSELRRSLLSSEWSVVSRHHQGPGRGTIPYQPVSVTNAARGASASVYELHGGRRSGVDGNQKEARSGKWPFPLYTGS